MMCDRYAMVLVISAIMFCGAVKGAADITGIRLVNGKSAMKGRVEVLYNGKWGTVCDDNFTDNANAAIVVCKSLNLPSENAVPRDGGYFGQGTGPITLDDVECLGSESSLNECNSSEPLVHNCRHDEDVGVSCDGGLSITVVGIRLVGGLRETEGRLEVLSGGIWGTVCSGSFDDHTAGVVCSLLGYRLPGIAVRGSDLFGSSTGPVLLDDLICHGDKTSLNDCQDTSTPARGCEDVGVICNRRKVENVRLVNGAHGQEGRVEILSEGVWGTVCDDKFNDNAARVVCTMLGYESSGAVSRVSSVFGPGTLPILLDEVTCSGAEKSLDDCKHNPIGEHTCDHSEDVGVVCQAARQIEVIRLVNGKHDREGRLEYRSRNEWGTICDDSFDDNAARVACTMLGYKTEHALAWRRPDWNYEPPFGQGAGQIMVVYCSVNQTSLTSLNDCQHKAVGSSVCGHGEDVGVGCYDGEPPTMSPRPITEKTNSPGSTVSVETTTPYGKGQTGGRDLNSNDDGDDGTGVIVGAIIGSLLAVTLVVAVVTILLLRRRRQKKSQDSIHDPSKNSRMMDCCLICDCT